MIVVRDVVNDKNRRGEKPTGLFKYAFTPLASHQLSAPVVQT